jgi:GalNAc-alpha-(1->4)-GalNAc-alpha-(1->3)-diNAcBac-PP-undecaprenol alpha-1,4-N-acetyl-D-galactosaminyltransferase
VDGGESDSKHRGGKKKLNQTVSVKRLCMVIPSLQAGGMERVMSELAWYFSKKPDLELHLVLYGMTREIFYELPERIRIHRPAFRFNNRLRLFYTVKTVLFLRSTVKRIHPDSLLSFGEVWNSFVLLGLLGLKYPVFISDRCSPARSYKGFHRFLRRWLYPKAAGIIAQTGKAREIYSEQFGHRNIGVIGNPIREVVVDRNTVKENIVLMVGRLIKTKHQDELIKLFLKIKVPGWKLVLVGYDHLKQNNEDRLKAIISENGAEDRVFLEGKQSDVDPYYSRSRIFAFTSSSEGFPNTIGEAMSAGLPVVAFDCVAGPSEMVRDRQTGFLVPLFDFKQFRERLEWLMSDEALRDSFGACGRMEIREFSMDRIGEKYLHFIMDTNFKENINQQT